MAESKPTDRLRDWVEQIERANIVSRLADDLQWLLAENNRLREALSLARDWLSDDVSFHVVCAVNAALSEEDGK